MKRSEQGARQEQWFGEAEPVGDLMQVAGVLAGVAQW
jgi:hypothetical protein